MELKQATEKYNSQMIEDYFSESTRLIRRNLLIAASVAVILSIDGIEIQSIFGIKFKGEVNHNILAGIIYFVVLFELISFISSAYTDYRSWCSSTKSTYLNFKYQLFEQYENTIITTNKLITTQLNSGFLEQLSDIESSIDYHIKKETENIKLKRMRDEACPLDLSEGVRGIRNNAKNLSQEITEKLNYYNEQKNTFDKKVQNTNAIQYLKSHSVDWGAPLALGVFGLLLCGGSMFDFLDSLF